MKKKSIFCVKKSQGHIFCHDFNKKIEYYKMYTQKHNNKTITKDFSDRNQNINIGNNWPTQ